MLTQKKTHVRGNLTFVKKAALPGEHSVECWTLWTNAKENKQTNKQTKTCFQRFVLWGGSVKTLWIIGFWFSWFLICLFRFSVCCFLTYFVNWSGFPAGCNCCTAIFDNAIFLTNVDSKEHKRAKKLHCQECPYVNRCVYIYICVCGVLYINAFYTI